MLVGLGLSPSFKFPSLVANLGFLRTLSLFVLFIGFRLVLNSFDEAYEILSSYIIINGMIKKLISNLDKCKSIIIVVYKELTFTNFTYAFLVSE